MPVATKNVDLASKYRAVDGKGTTMMVRNIPSLYTQAELIEEVSDELGCTDYFDFFYLPWNTETNENVGYCFVNFTSPEALLLGFNRFSKYRFKKHGNTRMAHACFAHIQGLENNVRHLESRSVVYSKQTIAPVVMRDGKQIQLSQIIGELKTQGRIRPQHMQFPRLPTSAPHASRPPPTHVDATQDAGFSFNGQAPLQETWMESRAFPASVDGQTSTPYGHHMNDAVRLAIAEESHASLPPFFQQSSPGRLATDYKDYHRDFIFNIDEGPGDLRTFISKSWQGNGFPHQQLPCASIHANLRARVPVPKSDIPDAECVELTLPDAETEVLENFRAAYALSRANVAAC